MRVFFLTFVLFTIYSFTRRDLNLTLYGLTAQDPLLNFGYFHRIPATLIFIALSLTFSLIYLKIIKSSPKISWLFWTLIIGIFAYPMFSYDIFNYLFNAKMVLIYHANPHLVTANQFTDDMLRFMHNTHTPAPYAYGWTIASLLPGLTWFIGKFTLSFWAMKIFIASFWLGQLWILQKLVRRLFPKEHWRFWLFALNPLVLVETLINGHNDVAMMFFALTAYWFYLQSAKIKAFILLLASVAVKYATVVLLPLIFLKPLVKKFGFPAIASIALLAVIFTRPDQLHSWYLIWSFSFAVLAKSHRLVSLFTALTIGALLRYAPYIYFGHTDPPVYLYSNLIWISSLALAPLIRLK